jgi:2-polyprenyl-3-methyl-5-hydroxy-6-metoxy-1,4-benzoquinol methylase
LARPLGTTTSIAGAAAGAAARDRGSAEQEASSALATAWRAYFSNAYRDGPRRPAARDYMADDLRRALCRLIASDASVLEVGCGAGDLVASLPQTTRAGVDFVPEAVGEARRRHPGVRFEVGEATDLDSRQTHDAIICDRLVHSVLDIRALLASLRRCVTDHGRIYLTTYNYLWELPAALATRLGWKLPSPTANWLSESDLDNLFGMTGLEVVKYEDRLLLPLPIPVLSAAVNQYLAKLPGWQRLSLYRLYVLRKRALEPPRRQTATVSVVVPTRNEAGNVDAALARTPAMGSGTELIFVEGGSTDGTWQRIQDAIASYRGPLQVRAFQQTGKGKGDAVRLGFARATGDLLMILDADLTVPPEELPVFFDAAVRDHADFLQGTRLVYPMDPGAMRFFNKVGNVAFSLLFSYLLQQPIKDTLCGTKVLWRSDYERIAAARHVFGDFDPFGDFDLIFGAANLNLKIGEIPVRYRERVYGETNISRWKHGWLLLRMSAVAARRLKYV